MTPESFAMWLQGYFELTDSNSLTEKQIRIIKDHLELVFKKITPNRQDYCSALESFKFESHGGRKC